MRRLASGTTNCRGDSRDPGSTGETREAESRKRETGREKETRRVGEGEKEAEGGVEKVDGPNKGMQGLGFRV